MLTLSSILLGLVGFAKYAWMLLFLFVPQVLDLLKPVWESVWSGVSRLADTIWQGAKSANFTHWMLVLFFATIAGAVGYHYGWQHAIDWGHEHFRWIAKKAVATSWWKFW